MKKDNMHLIPQIVIDCAEGLNASRNINSKTAYEMRLEAIRDYCDNVLKKSKMTIDINDLQSMKRNRK